MYHFLPVGSRIRFSAQSVFSKLQRLENLHRNYQSPAGHHLLRPSAQTINGTGMFTRCPSTTHFCLALGPD